MLFDWAFPIDLLIIASSLLGLRLASRDRVYSLSILRSLATLPLLLAHYLYLAADFTAENTESVLFLEALFALIWAFTAYRLGQAMKTAEREPRALCFGEFIAGIALSVSPWLLSFPEAISPPPHVFLIMHHSDFAYLSSPLLLFSMLFMAWKLECFWRNLDTSRRWEHKFFIVGALTICCSLAWAASYRLTYLKLESSHFVLLGCLTGIGWSMMLYAVARHRLLNRKIFISRTIIQASVAPAIFGAYLLGLGLISVLSHAIDRPIRSIVLWLLASLGLLTAILYLLSEGLRRRAQHFISTHFYVNKYEYRDEWLALSHLLRGATTELDIVKALAQVLSASLYTSKLVIWTGNEVEGYRIQYSSDDSFLNDPSGRLSKDDSIIHCLKDQGAYYTDASLHRFSDREQETPNHEIMNRIGLVLMSPILAGDELLGLIGLGEEFTGGRYGYDDYDLLAAIGSQAAASIVAARTADELATLRQRKAIDALSAFVLHDIKNAASMLSLIRQNAESHLNDPEFQADMLEALDDALKRLGKVQTHLATLKGELSPKWERIELCSFLSSFREFISRRLPGLGISVQCREPIRFQTDPELVSSVLENLAINSWEASGEGAEIEIMVPEDQGEGLRLVVSDKGPGFPHDLSPEYFFEPFVTVKPGGSGIGLWQARELLKVVGGTIIAENSDSGARFIILLP